MFRNRASCFSDLTRQIRYPKPKPHTIAAIPPNTNSIMPPLVPSTLNNRFSVSHPAPHPCCNAGKPSPTRCNQDVVQIGGRTLSTCDLPLQVPPIATVRPPV